jgi:hypothetical protein
MIHMHAPPGAAQAQHTHSITASHRRKQYHNMLYYCMHCTTSGNCSQLLTSCSSCGVAHCLCGCACTGITCSYVALAPVSTCLLTSGAMISASSSELSYTSLPRPLPQSPLPAPRPQAPPRPQLTLRLRFTPTTFRFAAACVCP